jgi:hypothetical protein
MSELRATTSVQRGFERQRFVRSRKALDGRAL